MYSIHNLSFKFLLLLIFILTSLTIVSCGNKTLITSPTGEVFVIKDMFKNYYYRVYDSSGNIVASFDPGDTFTIQASSNEVFYIIPWKISLPSSFDANGRISYRDYGWEREEIYWGNSYVHVMGYGSGHGEVPDHHPSQVSAYKNAYGVTWIILDVNDENVPERLGFAQAYVAACRNEGPTVYVLSIP